MIFRTITADQSTIQKSTNNHTSSFGLIEKSYLYSCPNSEGASTESNNNTSYESPASTIFTESGNITLVGLAQRKLGSGLRYEVLFVFVLAMVALEFGQE